MDSDKTQRDPFMQVVEDHLASGDPPETKAVFDKLVANERSPSQAKAMIATIVRKEMQLMMATGGSFDIPRFKAALERLLAAES